MPARIDRTGERRLMNCGEYATIIRYKNSTDIDVQFDTGQIVVSKSYSSFINGSISISRKKNRVGERRLMSCGEYATIIRYGGITDIDVKFDSGEVLTNRYYSSFKDGEMQKPVNRVGERRLMRCGEYATIIAYRTATDIDVKFDNGEVSCNKYYCNFLRGAISLISNRLGERRLMRCGEYATIIAYRNATDIDVKFDSGEVVLNKSYGAFRKGNIGKIKIRVGERRLMNCGEYATIIAYRSAIDIDIKFNTGEICYNRTYASFKKGVISRPLNRVGESCLSKCGLYASIIDYYDSKNMTIKFDSGDIIKSYAYRDFLLGRCSPDWYKHKRMQRCYYDSVLNDVIILMKDGSIKRKSELLGGIE